MAAGDDTSTWKYDHANPKTIANWVMESLLRIVREQKLDAALTIERWPVLPEHLAELVGLIDDGTISGKIAKTVMEEMCATSKAPQTIIEEKGLVQISNTSEIEKIVTKVIEENPRPAEQYRQGKTGNFGFFVGQVMKATGGRANPQTVNEILRKRLAG